MGVKIKEGVIEDLHFTMSLTQSCNLHCNYCPLENKNIILSYEILEMYIDFFWKNETSLKEKCKNIVIIFFGGEPMLEAAKIEYFLEKMSDFSVNIKYVIYSNGTLISEEFIKRIATVTKKKIIFYISIDGDISDMLENRIIQQKMFDSILLSIALIREYGFDFSITKVITKESSSKLFLALKFLDSLGPVKLDFQPAMMHYPRGFSLFEIKEILSGLHQFISFLKKKGYNELQILEYLGLPDDSGEYKSHFNIYPGFFCDTDGMIYGIIDGLSLFKTRNTLRPEELKGVTLGDIRHPEFLHEILGSYLDFEQRMLEIGLPWVKREYPFDQSIKKMMNIFFIKKLVKYRYLPNDTFYGK